MDLYENVCVLLKYADPELEVHRRLLKYKDQIERNVMLGPKARGFIAKLIQIKEDNTECKHVKNDGMCTVRKRKCDYLRTAEDKTKRYSQCSDYQEAKSRTDRPLGPLGGI